jgi:Uma2 family endonuclease
MDRPYKRLFELVDGILVEKTYDLLDSRTAMIVGHYLEEYLTSYPLGITIGTTGAIRLAPGLVRMPDVAYYSWSRLPGGEIPRQPIPDVVPNLVVEIINEHNTRGEMDRKYRDYFTAGVDLVWEIDGGSETVTVYTSPTRSRVLAGDQMLDGGTVLPGFALELAAFFARTQEGLHRPFIVA